MIYKELITQLDEMAISESEFIINNLVTAVNSVYLYKRIVICEECFTREGYNQTIVEPKLLLVDRVYHGTNCSLCRKYVRYALTYNGVLDELYRLNCIDEPYSYFRLHNIIESINEEMDYNRQYNSLVERVIKKFYPIVFPGFPLDLVYT